MKERTSAGLLQRLACRRQVAEIGDGATPFRPLRRFAQSRGETCPMLLSPAPSVWPRLCALVLLAGLGASQLPAQPAPLPRYVKIPALKGNLRVTGSDGHLDLARLWTERFKTYYPAVAVQVEGGGSGRGAAAVQNRECDFGLLARPLNEAEQTLLAERLPQVAQVKVATDVLAVFVHRDNPITGLSLPQLEQAFGAQPRSGASVRTWGELGATGPLANQPLTLFGRRADTGVYAIFKKVVLGGGGFRTEVLEQVGPASVVRGVADGGGAMGYAQLRSRSNRTRPLALGPQAGGLVEPTPENCAAGSYPLAHGIYLCSERASDPEVLRLRSEFLRFVLSREGQETAQSLGLLPLPAGQAEKELTALR